MDLTYVPDDNFEKALIEEGYDDELDDYVITENISKIKSLSIEEKNIIELTGIEDFDSLETLNASQNKIESINISKNLKLELLNLSIKEISLNF